MKKSTYKHILAGLVLILLLTSTVSHQTYAAGTKINKKKVSLLVSQSFQLAVSGTKSKIRWSSSDKKVAKVSSKGKVTGKKAGKATITAKVGSKTYKCKVTVKIGLSKKKVDLLVGGTAKIKLCGSKIKKVKTSNAKVATITKKGLITAVGEGNATITVTGKNKKKYKCKVSVSKPSEPPKDTSTGTNPKPTDKPATTKYYQVYFDSAGGSTVVAQSIPSGKTASVPSIPSRSGFIFDHWALKGAPYDFSAPVTADITLTAIWGSGNQTWEAAKEVKQVVGVDIAPGVQTETQVINTMANRGFSDYDVIYDFTMDGEYCEEVETVNGSSAERPRYFIYFVSDSGEVWTIYSINGAVMAYPASFNLESGLSVEVLVSETEEITSYDCDTDKYYVTIPDESAARVLVVDRIDAATLNSITREDLLNA